jgi:hypothetical protein
VHAPAIKLISGTNLDLVKLTSDIELGKEQSVNAIDPG